MTSVTSADPSFGPGFKQGCLSKQKCILSRVQCYSYINPGKREKLSANIISFFFFIHQHVTKLIIWLFLFWSHQVTFSFYLITIHPKSDFRGYSHREIPSLSQVRVLSRPLDRDYSSLFVISLCATSFIEFTMVFAVKNNSVVSQDGETIGPTRRFDNSALRGDDSFEWHFVLKPHNKPIP